MHLIAAAIKLAAMIDPRDEQRAWLRAVLETTGLSPTALAAKARLAQPTITTFLNKAGVAHALSARTVAAIEAATGMRYGPNPRPAGFRDSEAAPLDPGGMGADLDFVATATAGQPGVDPWALRSRALETAGYLAGDVLIVDLNAKPRAGDIVCAQIYDWARSRAETIFRIWEPPYLVAATLDPAFRTVFVVDDHNVVIKGVVMASIRGRPSRGR